MDKLEALNMLLRLIGSRPVNSLDTLHPAAANALATLDRVSKKTQQRGWWFNIDYNVELQPNTQREIILSDQITTVLTNEGYIQRSGKLYDMYMQTYKFDNPVCATKIIKVVEWDYMPPSIQEYCAYLAGAEFVRDEIEDTQKESSLKQDAGLAMLQVKSDDLEHSKLNIFNTSRILRARGGVQPYSRRASTRFYGTPDR